MQPTFATASARIFWAEETGPRTGPDEDGAGDALAGTDDGPAADDALEQPVRSSAAAATPTRARFTRNSDRIKNHARGRSAAWSRQEYASGTCEGSKPEGTGAAVNRPPIDRDGSACRSEWGRWDLNPRPLGQSSQALFL